MENLKEDYLNLKHKILFFFMPENIVFAKKDSSDTLCSGLIKSITPCFYWCSGHEFITDAEDRFLIQHQIYFINGNEIIASNISQHWSKSKGPIRDQILSFIDTWAESHKKILSLPDKTVRNLKEIDSNNNFYTNDDDENIFNFSDFAKFVAQSIFKLRESYIQQTKIINIDFLQKECWKQIALSPSLSEDARKFLIPNYKQQTKNTNIANNESNNKSGAKTHKRTGNTKISRKKQKKGI